MNQNEHIEKCKKAIGTVIQTATMKYVNGGTCGHTEWSHIASSSAGGKYLARMDVGSSYVDISYVDEQNQFQDLGNVIITLSTEMLTFDDIVNLTVQMIDAHENG